MGEGEGDAAGAGGDIEDEGLGKVGDEVECLADAEFGFGAGDEGAAVAADGEGPEFGLSEEVLEWFTVAAAGDECAESADCVGLEGVGVAVEGGAVGMEDMGEEEFGAEAGRVNVCLL